LRLGSMEFCAINPAEMVKAIAKKKKDVFILLI
jgi:hypothetical protein